MDVNEPVFTLGDLAKRFRLDEKTVRRMFEREPGVLVITFPQKGRRTYRTIRVPQSVLERVLARFMQAP
jgi:hypothetical protein